MLAIFHKIWQNIYVIGLIGSCVACFVYANPSTISEALKLINLYYLLLRSWLGREYVSITPACCPVRPWTPSPIYKKNKIVFVFYTFLYVAVLSE